MKFNNLAEQAKALFEGTVLLKNYYNLPEIYEEVALQNTCEPFQVYVVELRTDYELNLKEYEAAGVFYSDSLGAYVWPLFSCGTSWQTAKPQNIFTDWED